jgi:hypothetical protein
VLEHKLEKTENIGTKIIPKEKIMLQLKNPRNKRWRDTGCSILYISDIYYLIKAGFFVLCYIGDNIDLGRSRKAITLVTKFFPVFSHILYAH